jgi:hypothetical protein
MYLILILCVYCYNNKCYHLEVQPSATGFVNQVISK